ncbi:AAA family ATPase [Streptococcus ovis]|uniref:AAA family ATPase n=1 Tax=Streptococcus ovis TaxID=82806 RepID=UPI0003811386|nr:ATP-binding protein [Streptococcus ovis]
MLQKFKVEGFKNFSSKIEFNLTSGNYAFNDEIIQNEILNTVVIYGDNASGKSNLGLAIMDIITHLTDNEKNSDDYKKHFLNLETVPEVAKFEYTFNFNKHIVEYNYSKKNHDDIVYEELFIDGDLIIQYDKEQQLRRINLKNGNNINFDKLRDDQSLVKLAYVYATGSDHIEGSKDDVFNKFITFVDSMLSFDSIYGNHYQGYTTGSGSIAEIIIEKNKVKEYQDFLSYVGIKYNLFEKEIDDTKYIFTKFASGKEANFFKIMSKGTLALSLFFMWYMQLVDGINFMFIDEFDSYFHHDVSRKLIEKLKNCKAQVILTTHNTANMSNAILRPDSYFIISNGTIANIAERSGREIRQAQNIEKMYRAGSFDNE